MTPDFGSKPVVMPARFRRAFGLGDYPDSPFFFRDGFKKLVPTERSPRYFESRLLIGIDSECDTLSGTVPKGYECAFIRRHWAG